MTIRISRRAEVDLAETDFIARRDPIRADSFEDELLHHALRIAAHPLSYVERPELRRGLRSCPHGDYVIFFTTDARGVRIERILHGARDLGPLLRKS